MNLIVLLAVSLLNLQRNGVELNIESESAAVDPARNVYLTLTLKSPAGVLVTPPDLQPRVRGFSLAEHFPEEAETLKDGSTEQRVNWRLVPEPCAKTYRIAPFAVAATRDAADLSFVAGPVRFEPPAVREPVTGAMECDPRRELPPLTAKRLGIWALILCGAGLLAWGVVLLFLYLSRRVREHRMSPIERAWAELDRLLRKGLPGRGRYKDFYVELTMVVRRYVQRRHGIRAPHLTTEEFFAEIAKSSTMDASRTAALRQFLDAADMVKFAGVEATPEMADDATESARGYLRGDNADRRAAQ